MLPVNLPKKNHNNKEIQSYGTRDLVKKGILM